ncbi:MAG: hypothetical protein ABFS03_13130 [Chloroflexota bacterium]
MPNTVSSPTKSSLNLIKEAAPQQEKSILFDTTIQRSTSTIPYLTRLNISNKNDHSGGL